MSSLIILFVTVAAFAVSAWFTRQFCSPDSVVYMLDHPNERSLHARPTPRTGGIGILAAVYFVGLASAFYYGFAGGELLWLAGLGALVGATSFADDRFGLSPMYRLAAHMAAAALLVYAVFRLPGPVALPGLAWDLPRPLLDLFAVLFVVWMINLYNFMDGMDGFAGGMAVFGFGTFVVLGWSAGHESFALLALIVTAAAGGFLLFNFPPARIFMGDVGSTVLGFLAAVLILWAQRDGIFPFWIGVLVFSPFIVDATVTLIRRVLRGEKFWRAHKTHFYQRLARAGWGHRRAVLLEYAIMLGCGITALWVVHTTAEMQVAILAGWVLFYFSFFFWVSRFVARRNKAGTL